MNQVLEVLDSTKLQSSCTSTGSIMQVFRLLHVQRCIDLIQTYFQVAFEQKVIIWICMEGPRAENPGCMGPTRKIEYRGAQSGKLTFKKGPNSDFSLDLFIGTSMILRF